MSTSPAAAAAVRIALSAGVAAALAAALAGCGPAGGQGPNGMQMPPPPVSTVTVEPKTLPVSYEFVGQTAGYRDVEVRARVTGILLKRHYEEGARVKQGQSLFLIDPAPFQVALNRAEADLATADARRAQAARDAERLKPVMEIKAVSRKEFDDALSAADIAQAEVKGAQARVAEAKLNLGYTRVESPITGVSSRSLRSEGTLVSGPDVLLTTVTQIDPLYVIFGVPEAEHVRIRRDIEAKKLQLPSDGNFAVKLVLADGSTYDKSGRLGFTDVRVNTQTGTVEARATVPNASGNLLPGQFVRVRLDGATRPNAVSVPQRAVLEGPKGKYVYVVNAESKAEIRPVQVGDWLGDSWVIDSGLNAGDRVIVDGVLKIGPGAPVNVVPPGQTGDGKPAAPPPGDAKNGAQKS